MNIWIEIILLTGIGALIGGVTNSLAIKMLFRPYHPKFIGKWRLPFTPGLIPKRREELAEQLGKTVMDHLLTPESIRRKLRDEQFQAEVLAWARKEIADRMEQSISLEQWLERELGLIGTSDTWDRKLKAVIADKIAANRSRSLAEVLPGKWQAKIEEKLPLLADYAASEAARFIESPQGRTKVRAFIQQFFAGRGMFSNMLQMFFGNESMEERVRTELVKLLNQPMFRDVILLFIEKQWSELREQQLDIFPLEAIAGKVEQQVNANIPVKRWLHQPIAETAAPFRDRILDQGVPLLVDKGVAFLSLRLAGLLQRLHLGDVVKKQVETFAVERLEQLVLSISRREFKMITYLGALLGGLIGIVQALLLQLFGG
ncbi:MAG TPA: DUF445 family protein [Bacillales bacterium]|nr:DUF445 family protein [Bacillales bacterium]